MKYLCIVLVGLNIFIIFYAMIGYPLVLRLVYKIIKPIEHMKNFEYEPTVSYMIVAHNEEKVIESKLKNTLALEYPNNKLQIIVASVNSTDATNTIVNDFIKQHRDIRIVLVCSKEHKGKTNAQNEAQKFATGDILVMTDANTMVKKDAVKEIVSYFTSDDIAYVCGKLVYSNTEASNTSKSESAYWNIDLEMREIESRIWSITAGNGALYACRNEEYIVCSPIDCHDSEMPYVYGKQGKRALFNPDAIAIEKSGESNEDEYKRKVRMNRNILNMLIKGIQVVNPIKYGWFSIFYFGHRTCRYSLWWAHILLLLLSAGMSIYSNCFGIVMLILQLVFLIVSGISIKFKVENPLLRMAGYYSMTVLAQFHAVYNCITGNNKPVWEKVESTR